MLDAAISFMYFVMVNKQLITSIKLYCALLLLLALNRYILYIHVIVTVDFECMNEEHALSHTMFLKHIAICMYVRT